MVRMKDEYYKPVEENLRAYFHALFWEDILATLEVPEFRFNSQSQLIEAIRKGTIQYQDGVFVGKFNIGISRELSKYATYDGRSKVWRGIPPAPVTSAASVANAKAMALNERIDELVSEIPARVSSSVESLKYSIDAPLFKISAQAGEDLQGLGISIDMTPELSERLIRDYTQNQNLNIVNWEPDQVERMRGMIQENALAGYNRDDLRKRIMNEYGVSMTKAKFLARQESSLFMATVRDERYQDAGIEKYRWSATGGKAGDGRTRELHKQLHGRVFSYSSPPVIDERTGERGVPGQAYGCRCVAIPVI